MKILVFNCGSFSLKFELLQIDPGQGRRAGIIGGGNLERIGEARAEAVLVDGSGAETRLPLGRIDHGAAALHAIAWLETARTAPNSSPPSDTNVWNPISMFSCMIRSSR